MKCPNVTMIKSTIGPRPNKWLVQVFLARILDCTLSWWRIFQSRFDLSCCKNSRGRSSADSWIDEAKITFEKFKSGLQTFFSFLVTGIRQTSPKKLLSSDDHFAKTNQRMPRFHGAQLLGRQKLLAHQAQTAYLYMRITMLSCCAALLKHLKYIGWSFDSKFSHLEINQRS